MPCPVQTTALNISKAFYTFEHSGLLRTYLNKKLLCVVLDIKSVWVSEGSIPILFLQCINDLPNVLICNIAVQTSATTLSIK